MNYNLAAEKILKLVGGTANIDYMCCCVTRIRFVLEDESKADTESLKATQGVIGVVFCNNQYHIVIGSNAQALYKEVRKVGGFDGINDVNSERKFATFRKIADLISKFAKLFRSKADEDKVEISIINAPLKGRVIPLTKTQKYNFGKDDLDMGCKIIPESNLLLAPFDGIVTEISREMNYITVASKNGVEVLMHIGEDTANLKGEHFNAYVNEGDSVKMGDILIEFDADAILQKGYEISSSVIILNCDECKAFNIITEFAIEQRPCMTIGRVVVRQR